MPLSNEEKQKREERKREQERRSIEVRKRAPGTRKPSAPETRNPAEERAKQLEEAESNIFKSLDSGNVQQKSGSLRGQLPQKDKDGLENAEKKIFQSLGPEMELKRGKSEQQESRRQFIKREEDQLIDYILRQVRFSENVQADIHVYQEMIYLLSASDGCADFIKSWKASEPNIPLDSMTESAYRSLKDKADRFSKLCADLYL